VDPWPTTATSDPFDRAQRQLFDEERTLRALAEEQVREFRRLVVEFASAFLAEELDARRRADPHFAVRATPADWRALLRSARQEQTAASRWPAAASTVDEAARSQRPSEGWQAEAEHLAGEVTRLAAELELARAFRPVEPASVEPPAPALLLPAPVKPGVAPKTAPAVTPLGLADVRLPPLPPAAPARFADQLQAWPREALALAVLGVTGWSMRLGIADMLSATLGNVKASAGSLRRTFAVLAKRGFWIEQKVTLAGVHAPVPEDAAEGEPDALPAGVQAEDTTLVLVRLGNLGRDLLRACGIQPAPSEWELLLAAHGNTVDASFAGLACAFTYHARLRGYATAVCPSAEGTCAPAALVRLGDKSLLVAVVADVPVDYTTDHWSAQVADQGQVALMTLTPQVRDRLVAEAQAAGAEHGLATDLQTLLTTQPAPARPFGPGEACGPLWAVHW
jgi:hypothetical protein